MNKLMLTCAMSLMLLSTSAMAYTINIGSKKEEHSHVAPPPPPPPPPPQAQHLPRVLCKYAEPKCDRQDRIHPERYPNDQKMYSRGECYRGDKERKYDFYCENGEVWMRIDFRRDRVDQIECMEPRRHRFISVRHIHECEEMHRPPEPAIRKHHRDRDRR